MTDPAPQNRPAAPPPTSAAATKQKRSASIGQILAGILFVLIVIFIVENTQQVKIRIIAGPKVQTPLFVALLIAAVVGALISALLRLRRKQSAKKRS